MAAVDEAAFATDDMALATALAMEDFSYDVVKMDDSTVIWCFDEPSDEKADLFDDMVHQYSVFKLKVEARAFIRRFSQMRREVYALIRPADAASSPQPI